MFRWQNINVDSSGHFRYSLNTSPSFFVYKDMGLDIILYKFIYNLNIIISKYSISEKLNLDVFIKEWISYPEFKSFDDIMNMIIKSDTKFKDNKNILLSKDDNKSDIFYLTLQYFLYLYFHHLKISIRSIRLSRF